MEGVARERFLDSMPAGFGRGLAAGVAVLPQRRMAVWMLCHARHWGTCTEEEVSVCMPPLHLHEQVCKQV